MRSIIISMRLIAVAALFSALGATVAYVQNPKIQIDHLDKFNSTASEMIDVTVDEKLLQLAAKFLNPKRSPDEAKIKELIEGLK
ncbi:MAG TPA: hypothetical protein VFQ92_11885, partial [Blastocatellia bacterium]|nr:hypothetical protein [Blastocatellia bacterium]